MYRMLHLSVRFFANWQRECWMHLISRSFALFPPTKERLRTGISPRRFYVKELNVDRIIGRRVPEFSKTNKLSRVRNILSYFLGAMAATFKVSRQDYLFSIYPHARLDGCLGVWGKWIKRARFICNIQDFDPEQVMAGDYSKNPLILKAMMWVDKFSCRWSNLIITVGHDLVENVNRRFAEKKCPER